MKHEKYSIWIPDPLYKEVPLLEIEKDLIKTNLFQRLKNISQLGPISAVYPAATHTRFEHSIGTLYIADLMWRRLYQNNQIQEDEFNKYHKIIRLSALLHDIAHPPYSHVTENIIYSFKLGLSHKKLNHENVGFNLIKGKVNEIYKYTNNDISDFLQILERISEEDRELIAIIAAGNHKELNKKNKGLFFLTDLITGDFGCDRIDYLMRDSYFSGLSYGIIETNDLFQSLRILETSDGKRRLALDIEDQRKGIFSVTYLLLSRCFHFANIAYNPVMSATSSMLRELLKLVFSCSLVNKKDLMELFLVKDDKSIWDLVDQTKKDQFHQKLQDKLVRSQIIGTDLHNINKKSKIWRLDEIHPSLCLWLNVISERNRLEYIDKIQQMLKEKYADKELLFDLIVNGSKGIPSRLFIQSKGESTFYSNLVSDKSIVINPLAEQLATLGFLAIYTDIDHDFEDSFSLIARETFIQVQKIRKREIIREEWLLLRLEMLIELFQKNYKKYKGKDVFRPDCLHGIARFLNCINDLNATDNMYDDFETLKHKFRYSGKVFRDLMLLSGLGLINICYTSIGKNKELKKTEKYDEMIMSTRRFDIFLTKYGLSHVNSLKAETSLKKGYLGNYDVVEKVLLSHL